MPTAVHSSNYNLTFDILDLRYTLSESEGAEMIETEEDLEQIKELFQVYVLHCYHRNVEPIIIKLPQ